MDDLAHRVAIVTAATRGIGLACARALARHGAVTYIAARSDAAGGEIVADLRKEGCAAHFLHFDATDGDAYGYMVKTVGQREGRLDILVNSYAFHGGEKDGDLLSGDTGTFFETIRLNVQSVYLACKYAVPYMMAAGGSIVNLSSVAAVAPEMGRLGYTVSKAAVNALTRNIALQYGRYNIRCNAVLPGLIATPAEAAKLPDAFRALFLRHLPLGRVGTPEDVAAAVLYFASDASAYVTGTIHEVAGGYALGAPQYANWTAYPEEGGGAQA